MAASSSSSSSTSSSQLKKFNIFISFRGKDIRHGFLPFLCEALKEKGTDPFTDEKLLEGEQITPALEQAIRDSLISIVIFSKNYADSPWCLDELVVIDDCRVNSNQIVLPIFYLVDTDDVQELPPDGTFAKALQRLIETYPHRRDSLKEWSRVLKTISGDTKGWVATSNSKLIKDDMDLIQKISNRVLEILKDFWKKVVTTPSFAYSENKLVGMEWRVGKVISLLDTEVNDRKAIGIWGMAGIGKTTLAGIVFQQIKPEFDGHYFVSKVNEQIKKEKLLKKIIGALLKDPNLEINTLFLDEMIRIRLRRKKVLIVFDDVEDSNDVDSLAGDYNLYREGSRIIITSRNIKVLRNLCREENIYQVEKLVDSEDLQLFCMHAFHQNEPKQGFDKLSKEVITHAEGNPLALRVLGSNFYDMEISDWETELDRLKVIPNKEIQQVLKVSYKRLDRDEQNLFLDIACFFDSDPKNRDIAHLFNGYSGIFKGEPKDKVEMTLESFGFHAKSGIRRLAEKCLVNISEDGCVDMHNLLQQMGKEIVRAESKQPSRRSRLWSYEDIRHVLEENSGSDKIEGIYLPSSEYGPIELSSTAFIGMHSLRFIKFNKYSLEKEKICIRGDLEFLPKKLAYILWDGYPLNSLPLKFCPNNLVQLYLRYSELIKLWDQQEKPLTNLKIMDLSFSTALETISDSFQAPKLMELNLSFCKSLVKIPSSLQYMTKLTRLDLRGCKSICSLPSCFHLQNLEFLNLLGCENLDECPELHCNIRDLCLDSTKITQLPSSIGHCTKLLNLSLRWCTELENLPSSIGQLKSLQKLCLQACFKLCEMPDCLGSLESLNELDGSRSGIETLPSSINQLKNLEYLNCEGCTDLETLPPLSGLICLRQLKLSSCGISNIPESVGSLVSLEELYLDGNYFESLPESVEQLRKLKVLDLSNCESLRNLPNLPCLKSFSASNCISLKFASCSFLFLEDDQEEEEEYDYDKGFIVLARREPQCLDFGNCINLDNDVCLRIMEDVLSAYPDKKKFTLCIPGLEVLPRMRYQTSGCHLSFKLEKHDDITGFCFSAVIDPLLALDCAGLCKVTCSARILDESGISHSFDFPGERLGNMYMYTNHVFLWYKTFHCKEQFKHASFEFFIDRGKYRPINEAIIKCGVHIIS